MSSDEFDAAVERGKRFKDRAQKRIVESVIGWINQNFPSPEASESEAKRFYLWVARKGSMLVDQILRLRMINKALRRMDAEKETMPQNKRATFEELFNEEVARANDLSLLNAPLGADFLADVQRVTAWTYFIPTSDDQRDEREKDIVTVQKVYQKILPCMLSVAPSFLLALSHAETQFVFWTTDMLARTLARESSVKGSSASMNILTARGKVEPGKHDEELALKVYDLLPEKDKKRFLDGKITKTLFYQKFKKLADKLADNKEIEWQKVGKDGDPTPPSDKKFFELLSAHRMPKPSPSNPE